MGKICPQVKICGVTQAEKALALADLGVDALGFNFWQKSKRYVDPKQVAGWRISLPDSVLRVGLFVNAGQAEIEAVCQLGVIDVIQLHGEETPEFVRSLAVFGLPILKALRLPGEGEEMSFSSWQEAGVTEILIDAHTKQQFGGTGKTLNWNQAARFVEQSPLPVWLAGGLNPENIQQAVSIVEPAWVDTASGVEQVAGVQDLVKSAQFVERAKQL